MCFHLIGFNKNYIFRILSHKQKREILLKLIIKKRKSIREFNDKKIFLEDIHNFINIAKFAPSGKNRQPWKIIILEDKEKNKLEEMLTMKLHEEDLTGSLEISINAISQSNKTILFFNPYSYKEVNYSHNKLLMDTQSIGAFIQNFILLLTEKNISSLWINDIYYAKKEIEEYFTNNKMEIIAAISLGYSSKTRNFNLRNDLKDILI